MRLIDVAIPKFDEDSDDEAPRPAVIPPLQMPGPFILPPVIFGGGQEYNVEDGDDDDGKASPGTKHGAITPSSSRGHVRVLVLGVQRAALTNPRCRTYINISLSLISKLTRYGRRCRNRQQMEMRRSLGS